MNNNEYIVEENTLQEASEIHITAYRVVGKNYENYDEQGGIHIIFIKEDDEFGDVMLSQQDRSMTPANKTSEIGKTIVLKELSNNLVIMSDNDSDMDNLILEYDNDYYEVIQQSDTLDDATKQWLEANSTESLKYVYTFSKVDSVNAETQHQNIYYKVTSEDQAAQFRKNPKKFSFSANTEVHKFKTLDENNQNLNDLTLENQNKVYTYPVTVYDEDVFLTTYEPWRDVSKVLSSVTADKLFKQANHQFKISDILVDAELRSLYHACIEMTQASNSGFSNYTETEKIYDITIKNLISVQTPTCVEMVVANFKRKHPSKTLISEWTQFLAIMYSSSSFIAHPTMCHNQGLTEDHKVIAPYFIQPIAVNDSSTKKILNADNMVLSIDSEFLNPDFTSKHKFLKQITTEAPIFTDRWLKTKTMEPMLSKDTKILDSASLSDSSEGIKAYLVHSEFADIKKYLNFTQASGSKQVNRFHNVMTQTNSNAKNGLGQSIEKLWKSVSPREIWHPANAAKLEEFFKENSFIPKNSNFVFSESKANFFRNAQEGYDGGSAPTWWIYSWDIVYTIETPTQNFDLMSPVVDNHDKSIQSTTFGRTPIVVSTSATKINLKCLRMQSMTVTLSEDSGTQHTISIPMPTGKDESNVEKTIRI